MNILLTTTADPAGGAMGSGLFLVVYLVAIVAFLYFMMVRPQKKEQKRIAAMHSAMEMAAGADSVAAMKVFERFYGE